MARATLVLAVVCLFMGMQPAPVVGGVRHRAVREVNLRPPPGMRSRSMRYPWDGKVLKAMRLKESKYVRYVPEYASKGRFYGTWELVQLLERAARRVAFRVPGARLSVGEMSHASGGPIPGHRSHTSGRDVDIGFYMTTTGGSPYHGFAFAEFDGRGRGLPPNQTLLFDDARNWELVAKLVSDGEARIQYIFVSAPLRSRLLREGRRRGARAGILERAKSVLVQPGHGHPHRNHFHVRMYCPPADRPSCRDRAPFWPWYPGTPPSGLYTVRGPLAP